MNTELELRHPDSTASQRVLFASWIIVFGIAVLLRLPGLHAGLPYIAYVDEGHILHPVMRMLMTGTWDPGWYRYPSLTMNLIALAGLAADSICRLGFCVPLISEIPAGHDSYYDLIGPRQLVILGRFVVFMHSLGLVGLCGLAGKLIGGTGRTGVLAAGFCAITPALVSRGSIVAVDTLAATYFLLALFISAVSIVSRPSWLYFVAGGAAAGIAFTSKYQAGAAILAVALAGLLSPRLSFSQRAVRVVACLMSFFCNACISMPALLICPLKVLGDVRGQLAVYGRRAGGLSYLDQALQNNELGFIWVGLFLLGWISFFAIPRIRGVAIAWGVPVLILILVGLRYGYQPFRNLLPVVAVGCVIGSLFLNTLLEKARNLMLMVALAIFAYGVVLGVRSYSFMQKYGSVIDSRIKIVEWLVQESRSNEEVFVEEELAFLPNELARIHARLVVANRSDLIEQFRRGSSGIYVAGTIFAQEILQRDPALSELLSEGVRPTPKAPDYWRSNSQRVIVFRVR